MARNPQRFGGRRRCSVDLAVAVVVLVLALLFGVTPSAAQDKGARTSGDRVYQVVVVTSYDEDLPWQRLYIQGVKEAARSSRYNVRVYFENLDRKRAGQFASDADFARLFEAKYSGEKVDALLTHGSDARDLIFKYGKKIFPDALTVVTNSVGSEVQEQWADAIILQDENMRASLDVALQLHPKTKHVMVIADRTQDGLRRVAIAKTDFADLSGRYQFEYVTDFAIDELYRKAANAPDDTLFLYLLVFQDKAGRLFIPKTVMTSLARVANGPVYSLWDSLFSSGMAGGYLVSAEVMGKRSIELALDMAAASPEAREAGFEVPDSNAYIFDWRALKRWGARFENIPPEAEVRFRELTFFEQYLWESVVVIGVIVSETALVIMLIVLFRQRSRAMRALQRNESHLQDLIDERTAQLNRSNQDLQQFAYSVSHDLRAPLRTVSGFIGLLERRIGATLDEESRELFAYAKDGALRMDHMIMDMLDYSRIQTRPDAKERIALDDALSDALANLKAMIEASDAEIVTHPLPELTVARGQIVRLFQNLIGNAINYRRDGVRPRIEIHAKAEADAWSFTVADNGIGIPAGSLEEVFGLFRRVHADAPQQGTGVGLAICRRIVEQHNGTIWVTSVEGEGSTFHFTIREETD